MHFGDTEEEETYAWTAKFTDHVTISENEKGEKIVNEYTMKEKLGEGSYGTVKLVERMDESGSRRFAMKILNKLKLKKVKEYKTIDGAMKCVTALDKVMSEFDVMRHLYHRNCMLLFEMIEVEEHDKIYLIFELWEGGVPIEYQNEAQLFTCKETGGLLPIPTAQKFFSDLVAGVYYLKTQGVIHRDIKPENTLTDFERNRCCLSDFGSAKKLKGYNRKTGFVSDTEGTLSFFPPEACEGGEYDGYQADVWALGVTLYTFIFGKLPFFSETGDPVALFEAIKKDDVIINDDVDKELADLLLRLLKKDAFERITIEELMRHPWVSCCLDDDKKIS